MPNKTLLVNVISMMLQYSLLMLIYYFLFRVIKMIYNDLKTPGEYVDLTGRKERPKGYSKGKLVVVDSGNIKLAKAVFILNESVSIGRNEHNEIMIDDSFVSYEHANINRNKQGYWLVDLNSTNKTYLNDQLVVERVLLKSGDLIKIGAVTFSFEG